jgi:plastocyanin
MRLPVFLLILGASTAVAAHARAAGSITGSVKLAGKAPEPKVVDPKSDPYCAKQPAIKDEEVIAGTAGELKNVVVRITKGAAAPAAPPSANAVIEQTGCAYVPHVLVVQAGQTVEIRNSDVTFHSIHTYKGAGSLFNLPQVQGMPPYFKKFATAGDVIKLRCDIHKWMSATILVAGNPFFAVTGADGRFTLAGVPPGKYTVELWHERLGTKTQAVTVAEGKPTELAVELKAK